MKGTPVNLKEIAVDQIVPSPQNRRHIDTKSPAWKEFVGSIKQHGVMVPLIARPMPDHGGGHSPADLDELATKALVNRSSLLDLRAGHRRLAAAKEAGLAAVPVVVREMDDRTAMIVTISENKDREDLTPIEVAEQIAEARKVGLDDKTIAEKLGKTEIWVARRAKLMNLSKRWQTAATNPEHYVSTWPAAALEVIARLAPVTQDAISVDGIYGDLRLDEKPLQVAALEKYIASNVLGTLAGAPWKLDDASLLPKAGSCSECPKRASQEAILFEELREQKKGQKEKTFSDKCLDRACWDKKVDAHCNRKLGELEMEHGKSLPVIQSGTFYRDTEDAKKRFKGAIELGWSGQWVDAKASDPGAVPAVYIAGRAKGQTTWLKPRDAETRKAAAKTRKPGEKVITPLKERRKQLALRRQGLAVKMFEEFLKTDEAVKMFVAKGGALVAPLITVFGTIDRQDHRGRSSDSWKEFKRLSGATPDEGLTAGAQAVLPVLAKRLFYGGLDQVGEAFAELKRIAELIDYPVSDLEAKAAEELPEPASWAREETGARKQKPKAKAAKPVRPKGKARAAK